MSEEAIKHAQEPDGTRIDAEAIYHLCVSVTRRACGRNSQDAQDIAHDIWFIVMTALRGGVVLEKVALPGYIRTIARRTLSRNWAEAERFDCIDYLRAHKSTTDCPEDQLPAVSTIHRTHFGVR